MATKKKMLQAAAGQSGGEALNVEDVFSTYLYEGNNSTQTITNGIDLAGEGGLVWAKAREVGYGHQIYDTARGATYYMKTNETAASVAVSNGLTAFTNSGFTLGSQANINGGQPQTGSATNGYASWTFRKAPKFFDVVTYTGDGVPGRSIAHNLGCEVGAIFVKRTDQSNDWIVYHRANTSQPETDYLSLNLTNATTDNSSRWNDTAPTTTEFTVGDNIGVNETAGSYVAYLFAHNDGDGEFGPDGDADIIKCGSYTGNGSTDGPEIDLGFEPQWVMIKCSSVGGPDWQITDSMRGIATGGNESVLFPNLSSAENSTTEQMSLTPRGFKITGTASQVNTNSATYIYIAIRRGTKVPESATEVFAIDSLGGTPPNPPAFYSGWPVDMSMFRRRSQTANWATSDRLRGPTAELRTNSTEAEQFISDQGYDQMTGYADSTSVVSDMVSWMWKRAPGFFDAVAFTSAASGNTSFNHNLGDTPAFVIIKNRQTADPWIVYHVGVGNDEYLQLNSTAAPDPLVNSFSVGGTSVTVSSSLMYTSQPYIAYLFASLDGISKVGSYTGNGTSQTIDCGFTSGARFVLIKRTDDTADWIVYDTARGIVTGNEPHLYLNRTDAEVSNDLIDPDSSGFIIDSYFADWNASGGNYIFYAIA